MPSLANFAISLAKLGIKKTTGTAVPVATTFVTTWDTGGFKDMGDHTVTGALALTSSDAGSVSGCYTQGTLIADGTNIPTFDGATLANYNNTNGARNRIELKRVGNSKYWTAASTLGAAVVVPVPAVITTAPVLNAIQTGGTVSWTPGTVTGTPAPTVTYSLSKNGSVVAANATSGAYSVISLGDVFIVTQSATNASGGGGAATPVASASVTATGTVSLPNPTAVTVGDSITQYANWNPSNVPTTTFSRAATGIVTAPVANTTLFGTPRCYPVNMSDTSFEVICRNFYADSGAGTAGVSLHTSNTTVATATAQATIGTIVDYERISHRGAFPNFNALRQGGIELLGNFGHGGMLASAMVPQMTYALSFSPQVVFLLAGTNDAKAGTSGNLIFGYVKTLIDQATTAGAFVVVQAIIPLGVGNTLASNESIIGDPNGAVTTSANYQLKAYCAANPSKMVFADTFTPLCDKSGGTGAWKLYANMTGDGTHPAGTAPYLMATAIDTAVGSIITTTRVLSSSAADVGAAALTALGHTRVKTAGPWTLTTGGTFATGCSADPSPPNGYTSGLANGWLALRNGGTGTLLASMFDPGDGKGIKQHLIITASAAADIMAVQPFGSAGLTIAALATALGSSVTATDNSEWEVGFEVSWTGAQAAGLGLVQIQLQTNGSGSYGTSTNGETVEAVVSGAGTLPDAITGRVLITGRVQLSNAAITAIVPTINFKFSTITGVACSVDVRAVTLLKV